MIVQILAKEGRPVGSVNDTNKKKVARSLAFSSPVTIIDDTVTTLLREFRDSSLVCLPSVCRRLLSLLESRLLFVRSLDSIFPEILHIGIVRAIIIVVVINKRRLRRPRRFGG